MTDDIYATKSLIPFEEYYAVLVACVEDEEVINAINKWNEVNDKYYANGGDPLSDSREESSESYDAYNRIGYAVSDVALKDGWDARLSTGSANLFIALVIQLISKNWPKILPHNTTIKEKNVIFSTLMKQSNTQIDFEGAK